MVDFNNLPGIYVDLQDGNLQIVEANPAPVVTVLGTAEKGGTGVLYPVVRPADAVNNFGSSGTLIRGMYEARFGGSQNTVLMRIAAKPAKLLHIGDTAGAAGITLETVDKDNTAGEDMYVWYDDSANQLDVYDSDETLLFSMINEEIITDTGVLYGYGARASGGGPDIGSGASSFANAVLMASVTGSGIEYVLPTDGVDATAMELYEAFEDAYRSLEAFDSDIMVPMDVYMDTPNIVDDSSLAVFESLYDSGTPFISGAGGEVELDLGRARVIETTLTVLLDVGGAGTFVPLVVDLLRGTGTNGVDQIAWTTALGAGDVLYVWYSYLTSDALMFYRTWELEGEWQYEWHTERFRSEVVGTTLTTYEYFETSFAWQLANYCFNLTKNDNDCIGMIGVRPFRSTALKDLADWAGYLPTYTSAGLVSENGGGLAGNKFMAGKLVDSNTYSSTTVGDSAGWVVTDTGTGPYDLAQSDVLEFTVSVLVDGSEVPFTLSPGTGAGGVDQINLVNVLAGTEATFEVWYYFIDSVATVQYGPGFFATAEETVDGTSLSPAIDIGRYISVITSWPVLFTPVDSSGFGYLATGATAYGGFVSSLAPQSAPTNKVIPDIQMPFRMSKTRADDLVGIHYVLFAARQRGTIVVDAPTAARSDSDYQRLTTVRIVTECVRRLREALNPFIGEGITSPQMEAMQTTSDRLLTDAIKDGLIQRFEVSVTATPIERVQGKANVELLLVPAFELRQIYVTISLSAL